MTEKNPTEETVAPAKEQEEILQQAKQIIKNKYPEADQAPHGRGEDGKPLAPYGYSKVTGLPKKLPGRDWDKEKHRDKPRDERELLNELEEINLADFKEAPAQVAAPTVEVKPVEEIPVPEIKTEVTPAPVIAAPAPAATPGKHKVYISGAMFLFAIDLIIPKTIEFAYGFMNLKFTKPEALKMDDEEKKDLAPLCDSVVDEILAGLSPLQQFMLYTGVIYGSKVMYAETVPKKVRAKKTK